MSQSDPALRVHAHSRATSMLIVPVPPADVMVDVLTFRRTAHRDEGPVGVSSVVDEEPHPVANAVSKNNHE